MTIIRRMDLDADARLNKQEFIADEITNELLNILSGGPLSLDKLVNGINSGNDKEKLNVIRMLLDAGKIKTDGDRYYI